MTMSAYGGMKPNYGFTAARSQPKVAGYNVSSLSRLSPDQVQLFQRLLGGSLPGIEGGLGQFSQLASGGTPEMWEQLEAPAMRQFGALQGGLASRFSGMGMGARRSSGFQNVASSAAADLAERLQGQRMGLQQQAIRDLLGLGQQLLGTQTFENVLTPKPKPAWQEFLMGLAPGLGQGLGTAGSMFGMNRLGF